MSLPQLTPKRRLHLSPLRYPGGKAKLYPHFHDVLAKHGLREGATYVEPYAGGAGAAINLLLTGVVRRIVINDLDRAVHAFWYAAVHHGDELQKLLTAVPVTIDEWRRQKDIMNNASEADPVELGFSMLFLNRTNRSGVINAGPIGGLRQTGDYRIDARFNRSRLTEQLRLIKAYAPMITVHNLDGRDLIEHYAGHSQAFIYADPPYFNKAGSLYLNSFEHDDHEALAECLNSHRDARWILTYDDVPEVHRLYSQRYRETFSLRYSAYRAVEAKEIMVYSDSLKPT